MADQTASEDPPPIAVDALFDPRLAPGRPPAAQRPVLAQPPPGGGLRDRRRAGVPRHQGPARDTAGRTVPTPHTTADHEAPSTSTWLVGDPMSDDALPAWCDCGAHTLSRADLLSRAASGARPGARFLGGAAPSPTSRNGLGRTRACDESDREPSGRSPRRAHEWARPGVPRGLAGDPNPPHPERRCCSPRSTSHQAESSPIRIRDPPSCGPDHRERHPRRASSAAPARRGRVRREAADPRPSPSTRSARVAKDEHQH